MDATRLHLVRHGAVAPEWRERLYGCLDVPLAESGRVEAHRAAALLERVELAAVISSGLERAEFGAACIRAGRALERLDERELRELDRGGWAGLGFDELEERDPGAYARWSADPAGVRPPGGENLSDLALRVVPCLDRIAERHAGAEVAIVTHSWVIRVAVCAVLGIGPARCMRLDLPTGGLVVVDWPAEARAAAERGAGGAPVLVGFALEDAPDRSGGWFRGPPRT